MRGVCLVSVILCLATLGWFGQSTVLAAAEQITGVVTMVEPGECYVELPNRSSGLRVFADTADIEVGDNVNVTGSIDIIGGERLINGATLQKTNAEVEIKPFGMSNKWIGGSLSDGSKELCDHICRHVGDGAVWNWERRGGVNTSGLLVTIWGTVNACYYSPTTGATWFYIDDGSRVVSDNGDIGVLVYSDTYVKQGDFVSVTGIAGVEPSLNSDSKLVRNVRTRSAGDVAVIRSSQNL